MQWLEVVYNNYTFDNIRSAMEWFKAHEERKQPFRANL